MMTREEIAKHLSNMLRRKSLSDKDKEAIKYAKKYIASCHVGGWREKKCQPKDDTSHPFADDVLMGGDDK